ncbi:MAG: hypothetical protein QMD00_03350 [Hadesarchaea archaeon]|nr:hypothetical protein [Hadesarchaea archaeon]
MSKKQTVAIFIVVVAVLGAAVFYLYQAAPPAAKDELGTIDEWFSELDGYLSDENQPIDYDMSEIAGDWG